MSAWEAVIAERSRSDYSAWQGYTARMDEFWCGRAARARQGAESPNVRDTSLALWLEAAARVAEAGRVMNQRLLLLMLLRLRAKGAC